MSKKKDEIQCHLPPLKIKVLQTTKISKLDLLPLSVTKSKLHSHLITLAFFPKQFQEAMYQGFFNHVSSNQMTRSKISKSPQVRFPKVQPSITHVPYFCIANCRLLRRTLGNSYLAIAR